MFYDTILHLCELNGKKITNVIAELDLSAGNPSKWKSGNVPKADTLTKLADYFHVSVDYLLERESPESFTLSPQEEELILCYRQASPDDRALVDLALKKYRVNPAASDKSVG